MQTIIDGKAFSLFVSLACELVLADELEGSGEAFTCIEIAQEVLSNDNSGARKSLNEVCKSGFIRDVIKPYLLRAFIRWDELANNQLLSKVNTIVFWLEI